MIDSVNLIIFDRSILNWENKAKSAGAFIGYLLGVWFFEPWMITFGLLFPFIGNMIFLTVTGGWNKDPDDEEEEEEEEGGDSKTEVYWETGSLYINFVYNRKEKKRA